MQHLLISNKISHLNRTNKLFFLHRKGMCYLLVWWPFYNLSITTVAKSKWEQWQWKKCGRKKKCGTSGKESNVWQWHCSPGIHWWELRKQFQLLLFLMHWVNNAPIYWEIKETPWLCVVPAANRDGGLTWYVPKQESKWKNE